MGGRLDCNLESLPYINLSGDGVDGRVIICLSLRSRLRGLYVPPPPFSLFHNSWVFKKSHQFPFPWSIIILVKLGIWDLVIRFALMEKRMIKMLMASMETQAITRGTWKIAGCTDGWKIYCSFVLFPIHNFHTEAAQTYCTEKATCHARVLFFPPDIPSHSHTKTKEILTTIWYMLLGNINHA